MTETITIGITFEKTFGNGVVFGVFITLICMGIGRYITSELG